MCLRSPPASRAGLPHSPKRPAVMTRKRRCRRVAVATLTGSPRGCMAFENISDTRINGSKTSCTRCQIVEKFGFIVDGLLDFTTVCTGKQNLERGFGAFCCGYRRSGRKPVMFMQSMQPTSIKSRPATTTQTGQITPSHRSRR